MRLLRGRLGELRERKPGIRPERGRGSLGSRGADRRGLALVEAGIEQSGSGWLTPELLISEPARPFRFISPLLANVYLHYVLDLWAERWRRREAKGDMVIVRYADDAIFGFEFGDRPPPLPGCDA